MIAMWIPHNLNLHEAPYPITWLTYPLFSTMAYAVSMPTNFACESLVLKLDDKKSQDAAQLIASSDSTSRRNGIKE